MTTTATDTQLATLADVIEYAGSNRFLRTRVKRALNLGTNTMLTSLDIGSFLAQSNVGNDPLKGPITQRKLNMGHAQKMASFIFKGLVNYTIKRKREIGAQIPQEIEKIADYLGDQPYYAWSPIVGSIRDKMENIAIEIIDQIEGELILKLRSNQLIWVVDGQHRRQAWKIVLDFLNQIIQFRKYTKSGGLVPGELKQVSEETLSFWYEALAYYSERFSISIELHFGLTVQQEQQLFHDLNNLQITVASGLAQTFDQANPINIFTHRLKDHDMFSGVKIVNEGQAEWSSDVWLKLDHLNAINAGLFLNKTSISDAKPAVIHAREEQAWIFWEAVTKIPGVFDRDASVAAQGAILKTLGRVYFDILWSRRPEGEEVAAKYLDAFPKIDFSHENPLWNIRQMNDPQFSLYPRLFEYLPDNWRDKQVGEKVDGKIRFGYRDNESVLVLRGIVRYLAGLEPRL